MLPDDDYDRSSQKCDDENHLNSSKTKRKNKHEINEFIQKDRVKLLDFVHQN